MYDSAKGPMLGKVWNRFQSMQISGNVIFYYLNGDSWNCRFIRELQFGLLWDEAQDSTLKLTKEGSRCLAQVLANDE